MYLGVCSPTPLLSGRCHPASRSGTRSAGWFECNGPLWKCWKGRGRASLHPGSLRIPAAQDTTRDHGSLWNLIYRICVHGYKLSFFSPWHVHKSLKMTFLMSLHIYKHQQVHPWIQEFWKTWNHNVWIQAGLFVMMSSLFLTCLILPAHLHCRLHCKQTLMTFKKIGNYFNIQ